MTVSSVDVAVLTTLGQFGVGEAILSIIGGGDSEQFTDHSTTIVFLCVTGFYLPSTLRLDLVRESD